MGKPNGFIQYKRELPQVRKPAERVQDFKEFTIDLSPKKTREQAARCMDCGVPFCHHGCPLGNNIPEFNDAVYEGNWELAHEILAETNNFPEFTGRICPAPCEGSCVLGINQPAVTIEYIEKVIAEKGFELGLVSPQKPDTRTGKRVAVVGSGPAGLAAAAQLNKAGHLVTVFEKDPLPGGLLRYGIPDFKMEKWVVARRVALLEEEGIQFQCDTCIGEDISWETLQTEFDAVLMAGGAMKPRDMQLPGRDAAGIYFAMDYLTLQNHKNGGTWQSEMGEIDAKGKEVVVIGGGDTGSDCIGTANRQGAVSVTQITWGNKPPSDRDEDNPWPLWPMVLQTSSSHKEGCDRSWNIMTKAFLQDEKGHLRALQTVQIEWAEGRRSFTEIPESEEEIPCQLALVAVGFEHPTYTGMVEQSGVELDRRGNVKAQRFHTSQPGVFTAGDMHRGQSLVVWAISEGREAAREIDQYLMGSSLLPSRDRSFLDMAGE